MIRYFAHLLVISAVVCIPATCTDVPIKELSENAFTVIKDKNDLKDLNNQTFPFPERCSYSNPCGNGGTCTYGWCVCTNDYTGDMCDEPRWCLNKRCGDGDDVECMWDNFRQKGKCRCKKDNYVYLPKDKKCHECKCGDHEKCQLVDDEIVCVCKDKYAVKSSKCEACDCGSVSTKCSFNSRGEKICQCPKGYAPKTANWSRLKTWCEICDCGEHGRCRYRGDDRVCDCDSNYRYSTYEGKCKTCNCGPQGTCDFNEFGEPVCSCDYGYVEKDGYCERCDCHALTRRAAGIDCKFVNGRKQCKCPSGFETTSEYCRDIDECYEFNPCPVNSLCVNTLGSFDCRCKEGFEPIDPSLDPKLSGCKDINECYDFPCKSPLTRCVNNPGSYDCVCKDGYYSPSASYGSSYKPAYNTCFEIETQWREATIALGVIFSIIIIAMTLYIFKHKRSS